MEARIMILAMVLLVKGIASAQATIRDRFRFKDTLVVEKFTPKDDQFDMAKIKMAPGDYQILNLKALDEVKKGSITAVDLVYSDYPVGEDFSELNRKRMLELYIHLPQAFNASHIQWQIVKQTGVAQTGGIQNYFHGFVIHYRPLPTFQEEKTAVNALVNQETPFKDSTLLKVFTRNNTWKDQLVVCDVTGSMSPYTSQILFWIKANSKLKTFKQMVFFNDDDEKSTNQDNEFDEQGIWSIDTKNANKVIDVAFEAMQKGQHMENNLEAIFYAIKKYPESKNNVVLIADNWETPCDMNLLDQLKKENIPIKIIICGVTDRLNVAYLDLAYATGGSIHTMEEDLTNIAKMGEGKTFKINGMKFKMQNGKFIQISI